MRKEKGLVLCTLPLSQAEGSRARREREAKEYWDSLTPQQEAWALHKMGLHRLGRKTTAP